MRITLNSFISSYGAANAQQRTESSLVSVSKDARNFDEITIHSSSEEVAQKTFASVLSKALSDEVRTPTPETKINDLKTRIDNGTYQVDANAIASKILLGREDY